MNSYTGMPVNTVWFSVVMAALFSALTFAGAQATNAVFAVSIVALYVAYAIPIMARFVFENDFKPGPFDLGVFVGPLRPFSLALGVGADIISVEFTHWLRRSGVHGVHDYHFYVPHITWGKCYFFELHCSCPGWCLLAWYYFLVYGGMHWFTPVPNIDREHKEAGSDATSVDRKAIRETSVVEVV